ncbi:MAG: peptide-methionine (R)-S-oxide reductase MsrB [Granulosicoccaceae bacterium]
MKRLTIVTGIVVGLGIAALISFYPIVYSENTLDQETTAKREGANMPVNSNSITSTTTYPGTAATFNPDAFVKPSDEELKNKLSAIEYKVTQHEGTERAFSNSMHDEKRAGLYVDIVSGEPLFSSADKFDSRTGWPSFDRPIAEGVVVEKEDLSLFGVRTEIRSSLADSHLGHVFTDGPATTGNRYCMNAAAMRFIPIEQMAKTGYGAYIGRVSGNAAHLANQ